jgi:hypothetical protein
MQFQRRQRPPTPFITTVSLYNQITNWFHTSGAIDSVDILCSKFIDYVRSNNLSLTIPIKQVWKSLCTATCTLRKAYICNQVGSLRRNYSSSRPNEWKEEYEFYWESILETLFSSDAIDSIMDSIPKEAWENDVRNWREIIGLFLPEYIQPTMEVLQRYGYITRENNEWLSYEDQEYFNGENAYEYA